MTIWVLEVREPDDRSVHGVYASAELAMAAWPVKEHMRPAHFAGRPLVSSVQWTEDDDGWELPASGDDHAWITPYELVSE